MYTREIIVTMGEGTPGSKQSNSLYALGVPVDVEAATVQIGISTHISVYLLYVPIQSSNEY